MGEWINVEDRLPDRVERVLCACWDYVIKIYWHKLLWFENGNWWKSIKTYDANYNKHVTHWMPLPEPPKENT